MLFFLSLCLTCDFPYNYLIINILNIPCTLNIPY